MIMTYAVISLAPSHYLIQYWLSTSVSLRNTSEQNFNKYIKDFGHEI